MHDTESFLIPNYRAPVGFPALLGARVLVLLDAENLSYALAPQQQDVDYGRLRADLCASADEVQGHVIATVIDDDQADLHAHRCFQATGWTAHLTRRVTAGRYKRTNADPQILLHAGQLIERHRPDVVVLGSADGALGFELALFVKRLATRTRFMTLSAPGGLACLLLTTRNPRVDANLYLQPPHIGRLAPPEIDTGARSSCSQPIAPAWRDPEI